MRRVFPNTASNWNSSTTFASKYRLKHKVCMHPSVTTLYVAQALGSEKSVSPAPPKVTSKRRWICYAGIHYASRPSIPTPGLPPDRHAALWAADEGHGGSTSFELSAVSLKYLVTHPSHHLSPVTDCPRPLAALTQDRQGRQGMLSPYASPQFVLSLAFFARFA